MSDQESKPQPANDTPDVGAALVGSGDLFDSLAAERDRLILNLWSVYRRMSEVKAPESMKLDDLELWTKVTEHRTVQDILSNNSRETRL